MGFYEKMEKEATKTFTYNGSPTFSSSLNKNLDLFALGGALRQCSGRDVQNLFSDAFLEDRETALRNLVHLRDIRNGGLGERRAFREAVKYLTNREDTNNIILGLVKHLPDFGRWDDVVYIFSQSKDDKVKKDIARFILGTLRSDMDKVQIGKGNNISLAAKWLPSVTASSKKTRALAKELIQYMFGTCNPHLEKTYRKTLSNLRKRLDVVEVKMTAREWKDIDYPRVPSLAAIKYRKAFHRNDSERYEHYLKELSQGRTSINASVTYPYQIVQAYQRESHVSMLLEEAWNALPDYLDGSDERAIVVADTSGSMIGTPMDVAISLAIYCAQRLQGEFNGKYISFSNKPTINTVNPDATLLDNIYKVFKTDWGANTDINKVFNLILDTAISNKMKQEELPTKIIIVTDMQFDDSNYSLDTQSKLKPTNYEVIKEKFQRNGYKIPQVIFWNVNAESKVVPVQKDEIGTALVSGFTPSIFESVLTGDILNPEKFMLDTLYQEKYDFVKEF